MNESEKLAIIKASWHAHGEIERAYLAHPAKKGDVEWSEKQRLLMADMAIHLLQTALKPGAIELDKLQNNLHALLTISDPFLPHAELSSARDKLYG